MTPDELKNTYFEWMYQLVCNDKYTKRLSYRKLLMFLYDVPFAYTIPMDANRAEDGTDLRYRFGFENSYDPRLITDTIDDKPCSVLEMMVALASRCEEHIMSDPDIGNRTGQWFWGMIANLGLSSMSDARFDGRAVQEVMKDFMEHRYQANGRGGLFTVKHSRRDMRETDIWYQMCWYLDEVLER